MKIRQPVAVKFILTETAKQQIIAEQRRQIDQIQNELDQLEQQGKIAIEQAMAQGGEIAQQVRQQLENERRVREQRREELFRQMQQIQQLELGAEIQNMTVETVVDVKPGDDWTKVLLGAEIIVKDGIVVELRQNGQRIEE
ncbi:YlqD family protein [Alicyclobacillus mali]|uniref:YlqD family protein n=1 Tax=Alicyclobacillus mali (ex Roth et al. 2021) TaxID=1123961 RepID=A0ABS0F4X5_9BACL|nr:YlqD family protein [Alicyclobacillus mali (ex Roth et al. 2021)]MBF8378360.1 YlqD family protein [Alicyclobacillus mali (ex Roth et al. 2021)]MCL6489321.1 YlqD family protein [Alicyclobacillus mali (ex Roth et al. 2021)]